VEKAPKDAVWIAPFGPLTTRAVNAAAAALHAEERSAYLARHQRPYSLLYTYSLIIALVCEPPACRTFLSGSTQTRMESPQSEPRCG
jgi:hypothetical protein